MISLQDAHSHGFDIVNNVPHFARGAQHKHLPKARPEPTAWEQINEEALNSIDAQPLGDISYGKSVESDTRNVRCEALPQPSWRDVLSTLPERPDVVSV